MNNHKSQINIVWDMETNDPDDYLTLFMLLGHPRVNLKAVTVVPGAPTQIGFVRHALDLFGVDIPVGAHNLDYQKVKSAVSDWHYEAYGHIAPSNQARPAAEVLLEQCDADTTVIVGGPLTNIAAAIKESEAKSTRFTVGRLFVQGGFAGEGVVPPELQMEKFKGLVTCPTHNLIVDKKATQRTLDYAGFAVQYFVSKNVCHRVVYDSAMHAELAAIKDSSQSLSLIWQGMDAYLKAVPHGKMLHDPLAACCAIDIRIGTWAEVELFREGSRWGARLSPGSNTWIIVDYKDDLFFKTFTLS